MERRGSVDSVLGLLSETWSEATARQVLEDIAANKGKKKTTAEYAREHGFHPSRINWWRKELTKRDAKKVGAKPAAAFVAIKRRGDGAQIVAVPAAVPVVVPLAVPVAAPVAVSDAIELVLDGHGTCVVRVRAGFDVETLRRVLRALEITSC